MSLKYYPSLKNAAFICILFILLNGIFSVVTGLIVGYTLYDKEIDLMINIGTIITTLLTYVILFRMILNRMEVKKSELFNRRYLSPKMLFTFILTRIGLVIIVYNLISVQNSLIPKPQFLKDIYNMANHEHFVISIISTIVIPVIFEEILFRVFILNGLIKNYSPKRAIIISALLFSLTHLNPWQFLPTFLSGLIYAWIALKTKSIIFPILGHLINNLISLLVKYYPDSSFFLLFKGENGEIPHEITIVSVVIFLVGLYLIYNWLKDEPLKPIEVPQVEDITA